MTTIIESVHTETSMPIPEITDDRFAMFISAMPMAVAMLDRDLRYVAWSRLWADRFGIADRDLTGVSHHDVFPDLPTHFVEGHSRALGGEEISLDRHRLELVTGQPRWERWRIKPAKNALGNTAGLILFAEDITLNRTTDALLRSKEVQLRFVIDALKVGIVEWDAETNETSSNLYFREMLGLSVEELPSDLEGCIKLLKPEDEGSFRQLLADAVDPASNGVFNLDVTRTVSGKMRKLRFVGRFILSGEDEGRSPLGFVGMLLDETERAVFQVSLTRAQNLEAIGRITGIIAHDFNNLLSVILANAELAKMRVSDRRTSELLQNTINAAEMGGGFNKKLLALSRQRETIPQVICLDDHIRKIWVMFERLLNDHIKLKFMPDAKGLCARIDPSELDGALLNLVLNARDAQSRSGEITIATHTVELDSRTAAELEDGRPGYFVKISVTDTGIGMTASEIARARDPFYTSKAPQMGTGLGLTSVSNAMTRAGGFISIQSERGQGTTVSLFLPVVDCHSETGGQREEMPLGNGELVLVVEDDADLREATLNRLEALGYAVLEASNGQAALDLLQAGEPVDLVFSDIVMPGEVSGFDLEEMVRIRYPGMAVLLTTGHISKPRKGRAKGIRRAELLKKPYSLTVLAQAIERALSSGRLLE